MPIIKGRQARPRRILVYGENGVGKSTFAAQFPTPVFLNIEDGIADLDVDKTHKLNTFPEFAGEISWLIANDTEHQTIIIDTIDWLETLICTDVASNAGKATVEEIAFGKGYPLVEKAWHFVINSLTRLWGQGRNIIFTCHASVKKFEDPNVSTYSYWSPQLKEKCSGCIAQWCDEVFFARTVVHVIQKEEGFNKTRNMAIGGVDRVMVTVETASQVAKNRLGLPMEMPFSYEALKGYLPPMPKLDLGRTYAAPAPVVVPIDPSEANRAILSVDGTSISGLVVNGSSK